MAITYRLSGPATAAAVARGESTLLGAAIAAPGADPLYLPAEQLNQLSTIAGERRTYRDAVLARVIEEKHDLSGAAGFDCIRVERRILGTDAPNEEPPTSPDEAIARAVEAHHVHSQLQEQIVQHNLQSAYLDVELPVVDPTVAMIRNGVGIDVDWLDRFAREQAASARRSQREVVLAIGRPINLNSYPELAHLLYNELDLPRSLSTRSGEPSTSLEALEQFSTQLHVVEPLKTHVQAETLRRRAAELQRFTAFDTARAHTQLDQLGAFTGRFSSSRPALQNLPRPLLRAIVAPANHALLEADFSQIELRVLAHFSGDPRLKKAFADEQVDLHRRTASVALGIPEEAITDEQRQIGKRINFAVIYGQTAEGLARDMGTTRSQAHRWIDAYFQEYAGLRGWLDYVHQGEPLAQLLGQRRRRTRIQRHDVPATLRRETNELIQGTAADLLKMALARLRVALPADARMILTVHDSVLRVLPASVKNMSRGAEAGWEAGRERAEEAGGRGGTRRLRC